MNINDKLPDGYEWYKHQIAGHNPAVIKKGVREIGIVTMKGNDHIFKFVQNDKRGECELKLYEDVEASRDQLMIEFGKFLPSYFGQRTVTIGDSGKQFMELEDVTKPFAKPCIMDIKIGRVSYDPTANENKKALESSKCACQTTVGFRVLGYKMHADCGEPISRDRAWGKALTEDAIPQAFKQYLLRGWPDEAPNIIAAFIERIKAIRQWFDRQRIYHFYASSLLLVYEGQPSKPTESGPSIDKSTASTGQPTHSKVDVRMIDFSHTFDAEGQPNDNYTHGIDYILNVFQRILDEITG